MIKIDTSWTLFLDRDGVINQRLPGAYVKSQAEFRFCENTLLALQKLAPLFGRIVVVTNQQGIGKGLMTEADLEVVHQFMLENIDAAGGRIDAIYFCPDLAAANSPDRKPQPGMAYQAQANFPEIDFSRSIIVGDSASDMKLGKTLGMKTIFITDDPEETEKVADWDLDERLESLWAFAGLICLEGGV